MHYSKHSRDELFQDFFRLFGDDFIWHLLRQRQNLLNPIAKTRSQLVILVLFLQELNRQALLLRPICQQRAQTLNVTPAIPKRAFEIGLYNRVSISCSFHAEVKQPTWARTALYLFAPSTDPSIVLLITDAFSFSNFSSLWSNERRASAYADIIR